MALQPVSTATTGGIPVFVDIIETRTGGVKLVITGLTAGSILPAGTPLKVDEAARTATVCKTAVVYETTSGTAIKVKKGCKQSQFAVGDYLCAVVGGAAYAITVVTEGTVYDTLTIGTTLGTVTAGDLLFESSAAGASAGALKNLPNGLSQFETKVVADEPISDVIRGTIYVNRAPGITTAMKAGIPHVIFNDSY
jgi:hypothetical protein